MIVPQMTPQEVVAELNKHIWAVENVTSIAEKRKIWADQLVKELLEMAVRD